jgi:hypothetical protein
MRKILIILGSFFFAAGSSLPAYGEERSASPAVPDVCNAVMQGTVSYEESWGPDSPISPDQPSRGITPKTANTKSASLHKMSIRPSAILVRWTISAIALGRRGGECCS